MRRFLRFAAAGGVGFIVDVSILMLLLHFTSLGPFGARAISIPMAVIAAWMLNRTFTFDRSGRSLAVEGFRYGSIGVTSALLNYALYSALLMSTPILRPTVALVLASAAATGFSFFGYSRFVFRR
ncbi:GtrA family protein [Rhizobium sp. 2YAF20]|uniref:GtrA family protein n=1 Tax=Rhizobium sp. 2YAF20 TaxID=3233027 RepID=UPI003F99BFC9